MRQTSGMEVLIVMIKSMTGYGRAQGSVLGRNITVEIKSVNHRYFDFSCKMPRVFNFMEEKIKSYINTRVSRGKVDLYMSVETVDEIPAKVMINHSVAGGYINAMKELADYYKIDNDVTVSKLLSISDIFLVHKAEFDEDELWDGTNKVVSEALDKFIEMREHEGENLKQDMQKRGNFIVDCVNKVEEQSPKTVKQYTDKLSARMSEVLGEDVRFDEQRILTEAAIFADRIAVAEETVRLKSHFNQMNKMLLSDEPIGRKLDFLVQEMNREANTIGSKAQDAVIACLVMDIKSEIEKIREQVQNIE